MADGRVVIDVILDDGRVTKGVANIDKSLGGLGQTARRGAAVVGKLAAALGLVYVAKKGIDLVTRSLDGAIDRYDTLNNFPRVMQQMGFDAEASEKAIQRLSDGVQGLPTRLDEVAKTTQRIAIMTGDLDGAVETTLALNNAFLASGASQADAARAITIRANVGERQSGPAVMADSARNDGRCAERCGESVRFRWKISAD